ncbi:aromatic amino acid ammonia-lyase [Blastococcus sp. CT_GayMR16]|uniref:aromatic amino acid ammonia-lyase n=1 Tax=Blastococcus sp. CT_GayMR16 TaxID=2559607 RepID=UPI001073AE3E|nr:aromatic amino acid ammonia-lyase [Blastococcus sp. CT_GayMR16]TFV90455.1 aromatic amino acid lyase [Blastococcus sp. CT_GayMR16]
MDTVVIDVARVPLTDLLSIARGASVGLADGARERIASGRRVVDGVLASGRAVYGLTTGVGHLRDVRVPDGELIGQQYMIVMTHSGGFGPLLPTEVVRAAMAVRLVGLTRGGSGASPAVAESLVGLLNAGVHPLLPRTSSVGAGDLGAMALVAQVAIGAGRAEYLGELLSGGEALARAGIAPLVLQAKDGLAMVSANGVSVGQGALVAERAGVLADAAELVAALSMEATRGNPSVALPVVAEGKPFPGLAESCRQLREALSGSYLLGSGVPASVQDPLSYRVVPQVHGAFRDTTAFVAQTVETELNSQADNPLVSPSDGTLVSNGNFHPVLLAVAFDALRVAIAHVGQLSDRRLGHLWAAFFEAMSGGSPSFEGPPPDLPGMHLRYAAAAAYAELRQLAAPVSLDVGVLDQGVEDHSTAAPLSVRKADEALDLLADILTIELLLAADILDLRPELPTLGAGTAVLYGSARGAIAALSDRSTDAVHAAVRATLSASGVRSRRR